ncbi:MAG TPA: hypothetical protein VKR82_05880 [Candidatus Acidoferrales bacterium]|nr:hypothetical protein [Candidatus Acidoferrales bacterium]
MPNKRSSQQRATLLLAMILVASAAARGNDPWKDKDFTDWDLKDVQRILTDSPWTRQIQFGMQGADAAPSVITSTTQSPVNDPLMGGVARGTPANAASSAPSQGTGPVMLFTVSWISSRTIREAKARSKELSGMPPAEARTNLATLYDNYQIAVVGNNLSAFAREGAEKLMSGSYLMSKKSKEKVAPARVFVELGDSTRPGAIIYEFPKKSLAGAPLIPPGEKGVEFYTAANKISLKISFDITKMTDKRGPDL